MPARTFPVLNLQQVTFFIAAYDRDCITFSQTRNGCGIFRVWTGAHVGDGRNGYGLGLGLMLQRPQRQGARLGLVSDLRRGLAWRSHQAAAPGPGLKAACGS